MGLRRRTGLIATHIDTGGCQEFRELVVQPLPVFKEIVLVPAVELVPIFGGLAIIFFYGSYCRPLTRKGGPMELTFITIVHGRHLLPVQGLFYRLVVPLWG